MNRVILAHECDRHVTHVPEVTFKTCKINFIFSILAEGQIGSPSYKKR